MPPAIGLQGGRLLGTVACRMLPRHRRIARANLKFAFRNEKSAAEIDRIVLRNFQQWGMIAFEWAKVAYLDQVPNGRLPAEIKLNGLTHLRAAKRKSPAVLLLSAHFGNWEFGHQFYSAHINPLNFIVRRIDHPFLEKRRLGFNAVFGTTILYKENGLKKAIKNLKNNQDLIIFADQKANVREGIPSRFFGHQTTAIPIVGALAKKFGFPIVPMFVVRRANKAFHEVVFLPELDYSPNDTVATITQRQNDIIEQMIRKHPDHWLWMHRRWKTEHPEIYR